MCKEVVDRFCKAIIERRTKTRDKGKWLDNLRQLAGLSNNQLASSLGVDDSTVHRWINGKQNISEEKMVHIQIFFRRELNRRNQKSEFIEKHVKYDYSSASMEETIIGYLGALELSYHIKEFDKNYELYQCLEVIFANPTWADDFRKKGESINPKVILDQVANRLEKPPKYYTSYKAISDLVDEWGKRWADVMMCLALAGLRTHEAPKHLVYGMQSNVR
jgi:transcriptional regulator with XRE-family HTH domain